MFNKQQFQNGKKNAINNLKYSFNNNESFKENQCYFMEKP